MVHNRNLVQLVLLLVFSLIPFSGALALDAGDWDYFEINAQYRGGVKKGFESVGCALAYYAKLGQQKEQVIFHGCVQNPDKKNIFYVFQLNVVYQPLPDGAVSEKEIYGHFEGLKDENEKQVKDMIMLLPLLRGITHAQTKHVEFKVNQSVFPAAFQAVSGGRRLECTVSRGGKSPMDGKFFWQSASGGSVLLEKFHLRRGKISMSFVKTSLGAIQQKFQKRSPFDKVVFGKPTH